LQRKTTLTKAGKREKKLSGTAGRNGKISGAEKEDSEGTSLL